MQANECIYSMIYPDWAITSCDLKLLSHYPLLSQWESFLKMAVSMKSKREMVKWKHNQVRTLFVPVRDIYFTYVTDNAKKFSANCQIIRRFTEWEYITLF